MFNDNNIYTNYEYQRPHEPNGVMFNCIMEEWVPVIYEDVKPGLYLISSLGRVFSYPKNDFLSPVINRGYLEVGVQTISGKRKILGIHRLVATAFIPNPDPINKIFVNHMNLIRHDNCKYNLEWVTHEENMEHAAKYYSREDAVPRREHSPDADTNNWGKGHLTFGENNGMAVWTEDMVHMLCQAVQDGLNYSQALQLVGIEDTQNNRTHLSHIIIGTRWGHISKLYNLNPKKLTKYDEYIIPVCELLSKGITKDREIIETLQIPGKYERARFFVGSIRRRDTYTNISCNYDW